MSFQPDNVIPMLHTYMCHTMFKAILRYIMRVWGKAQSQGSRTCTGYMLGLFPSLPGKFTSCNRRT